MWHTSEGAPEGATFRAMAPGDQVAWSRFRAGSPAIHACAISRPDPSVMAWSFAATDTFVPCSWQISGFLVTQLRQIGAFCGPIRRIFSPNLLTQEWPGAPPQPPNLLT